ncbi:NAD(P)-binding domain-containing protein [Arthrobacter sp. SLBN-112]|uniref:NADPH-dependent F420 reductase n=1 Tax=Arthrobacter sp. SLBN-112 TaxID=2768452 RepID=UPI0027B77494|nr:NAD(P)-binding domain-containing protein [Arthrobacter sp. SLBN-112]MDQ0802379.1 putative dinucleotide-binding enzyme [Arthrobacter sp. SLBN-112]
MKTAVLGTGVVGRTIAARLAEIGHSVAVGTRDPQASLSRTRAGGMGNPAFATWAAENPAITVARFSDAAKGAGLIVNATNGGASLDVLEEVGAANLEGAVVLDIANPLDFSNGMPPTLFVKDTDSLAEQIQRAFPAARVVKALNTMNADLMAHPGLLSDPGSVFVSGNDAEAKAMVTGILKDFGHQDIIDLGDITTARGTEMLLPVWLRLWGALGTPAFNFKIVR